MCPRAYLVILFFFSILAPSAFLMEDNAASSEPGYPVRKVTRTLLCGHGFFLIPRCGILICFPSVQLPRAVI